MNTAESATTVPRAASESLQPSAASASGIAADLVAVLVAVTGGEPRVLTLQDARLLPSGAFELTHRSLQSGPARVGRTADASSRRLCRTALYLRGSRPRPWARTARHLCQLSRPDPRAAARSWRPDELAGLVSLSAVGRPPCRRSLYDRRGDPARPARFCQSRASAALRHDRANRIAATFGTDGRPWNEEFVLQRYELLYEAGLIPEARRGEGDAGAAPVHGRSMSLDHRRILATGIARLRAKIKYHPVVFELMPDTFTLLQLQRCVEALAGRLVHKQNFRRLVEQQELVEETGQSSQETGGRPAKLFRFRRKFCLSAPSSERNCPFLGLDKRYAQPQHITQ